MAKLSLSEFVEIASVASTQKITKIKAAKNKPQYHPATDFYKALRDAIVNIHQNNLDKKELDNFLLSVNPKKSAHYGSAVDGYKKWCAKKI